MLIKMLSKKLNQAQVAPACNPSYSGGRDQEDHNLKPATNYSRDPILKNITKKSWWSSSRYRL
jgi:hypothetical protein